jgi:hypothetical protein
VRTFVFHTFSMGDVEDPEIYCAVPISEWQKTEKGQWVMEHCPDPQFRIGADAFNYGHKVSIYGPLKDEDAVFYSLKYLDVK